MPFCARAVHGEEAGIRGGGTGICVGTGESKGAVTHPRLAHGARAVPDDSCVTAAAAEVEARFERDRTGHTAGDFAACGAAACKRAGGLVKSTRIQRGPCYVGEGPVREE